MTLLYADPLFLKHDTGRHPETALRLKAITAGLEKAGLIKKCTAGTYKPLTEEVVGRLHDPKVVVAVKQLAAHGGGRIAWVVVSPKAKRGYRSSTPYQHQSALRLSLKWLGVTAFPNAAADAPDMDEFFTPAPAGHRVAAPPAR